MTVVLQDAVTDLQGTDETGSTAADLSTMRVFEIAALGRASENREVPSNVEVVNTLVHSVPFTFAN